MSDLDLGSFPRRRQPTSQAVKAFMLRINQGFPQYTTRALREAKYLEERIDEAAPLSEALQEIYRRVNVPPEDRPPPEETVQLVEEAKALMEMWARRPYESAEVRKFAVKILNGIGHWFTFLTVPGVEATNNRAERALREHVVQRKIMSTFRNGKGTGIYETMMTVLSSWKLHGCDISQTMGETLTQEWTNS